MKLRSNRFVDLAILVGLFCIDAHVRSEDTVSTQSATSRKPTDQREVDNQERAEFFENQIRPLLVEHCYDCHSGDEVEAGLRLDSKAGWQNGGDTGAAIVPGKPDESLLIDAVRYTEKVIPGMPPDSKLDDKKIELLEKWVRQGAFDPRQSERQTPPVGLHFDVQQRKQEHWSWAPVEPHAAPSVSDESWPVDPIDFFVQEKIEQAGLKPALPADKLTWLRRVSFDLTGLPPSLDQITRFLNDESETSKEDVVDELLGSVGFGEKWARHWMDVTRYADTYGHEFDYEIRYAHEYRDYLIRALNRDVPYDQLVREHVAGDLIENPRINPEKRFNESIIGTGFWYLHEATHAPTDVLQNESDIASNQIDVFGKGFLGLTVACARCHDHKFDAISTADYYGLFAYLQSSCRQEYPLDPGGHNQKLVERIAQLRDSIQSNLADSGILDDVELDQQKREQFQQFRDSAAIVSKDWDTFTSQAELLVDFQGAELPKGWSTTGLAFVPVDDSLRWAATVSDGVAAWTHQPDTVDSGVWGSKATGILRSPTFEITANQIHLRARSDANMHVRLVIDNYQLSEMNGLLFNGTFLRDKQTATNGQWRWLTLAGDVRKYVGHRAYLEVIDRGEGSIAIDEIWVSDRRAPAADPVRQADRITEADNVLKRSRMLLADGKSTPMLRWMLQTDEVARERVERLMKEPVDAMRSAANRLRPPRYVVAMAQGTRESMPIYIRGGHSNRGTEIPPRNLEALGGREGNRLELADQIASIENPLTARVFVNRVWHHLFGRGIVASVDDFGPQGIPPTHPELLDHLADRFAKDGWSIKTLIRGIVLSQTYGQSSLPHPSIASEKLASVDPENLLLHRMNVRRLPAESIRDGILAVSGSLSSKRFGPGVATYRTPFMTGRGARPSGPLDGDRRRSVYQAIYRNFLNPFLTAFDMPNPFGPKGRRSESNVPAQSLAMMNDAFVVQQARRWAESIDRDDRPTETRIREMVLAAHCCEISDDQTERLVTFLNEQTKARRGDQTAAWQDLCQSLWAMKAFLYVR